MSSTAPTPIYNIAQLQEALAHRQAWMNVLTQGGFVVLQDDQSDTLDAGPIAIRYQGRVIHIHIASEDTDFTHFVLPSFCPVEPGDTDALAAASTVTKQVRLVKVVIVNGMAHAAIEMLGPIDVVAEHLLRILDSLLYAAYRYVMLRHDSVD